MQWCTDRVWEGGDEEGMGAQIGGWVAGWGSVHSCESSTCSK